LHPAPHRALFLGLGTGVTASVAAEEPGVQVDAVELLPEVITASAHFRAEPPANAPPQLNVMAADARRYVRAAAQRYDVIVSDNFHPARSGSGSLYTVEHFQAVRNRLADGGLFCQWLPLHQLDNDTLRSVVQSFLQAFPHGSAMLASNSLQTPVLGLVGRADDGLFDARSISSRLAHQSYPQPPAEFGLDDEFALLGSFVADHQALARLAGNAAANTDDQPVVAYRAPRITYAPDSSPADRLIALLHELSTGPNGSVVASADPAWQQRLAAYRLARNQFIESGRHVRPTGELRSLLAQVQEPLLAVLSTSPDFRPAYDPLLRMAGALAAQDPAAAQTLLQALAAAQPARPEAGQALQQLAHPSR
jgi:spermidine synthase